MTFQKLIVFVNALVPLALLAYDARAGRLGANPIEFFLRTTGVLSLIFLLITLAVTPIRHLTSRNELIRIRRMLGLFAFFYAAIHLVTYAVFDKSFGIGAIVSDVYQRPFIAVGMTAFVILVPLAATSANRMVKLLGGKVWARIHRFGYLAAILGVVHFWMIVKSDLFYPVIFAAVLAALLGYRIVRSPKLKSIFGRGGGDNLRP